MNRDHSNAVQEALPLATGPTIGATHRQSCGWCRAEVATTEPITYTWESGWCHQSCTTLDEPTTST